MTDALIAEASTLIADTRSRRKAMRRYLSAIYGAHCIWCGREFEDVQVATLEHLVPAEFGGACNVTNLRLACEPCNLDRNTWYQIMLGRTKRRRVWSERKRRYVLQSAFIDGGPFK